MGKKKSGAGGVGLGRALIKERLTAGRGYRRNDTWVTLTLSQHQLSMTASKLSRCSV